MAEPTNGEFLDRNFWVKHFGVFRVPLFHKQVADEKQFVLLNGSHNNFCIDYNNKFTEADYKSFAWSSGVDNFLAFDGNNAHLFRWFKRGHEKISLDVIKNNLPRFYEYLGKGNFSYENAIVPFVIRIFRKLRNQFKQTDGAEALKAFLYLLSSLSNQENLDKGINPKTFSMDLEEYLEELKAGFPTDDLKPHLNLILRHAAGRIFEEAHFEAYISPQLELFPSPAIKYKSYNPKQYGAYFTPSYLSRTIVEESLRCYSTLPSSLTIFDPASGSSEFLTEILRQLKSMNYAGKIKLIGWDISESALDISKFILNFELKEWDKEQVSFELKQCDSLLLENKWPKADIILMNPPFLSWELMKNDASLRLAVKNVLDDKYSKSPNLASAFFWLAINSLKTNGIIGCLLPSAILNSDSHLEIRKHAKEIISPKIIGRLGSFVFENALVDACMLIATTNSPNSTTLLWTQNISDVTSKALRELRKLHFNPDKIVNEPEKYSIYNLTNYTYLDNNWMPTSYFSATLKEKLEKKILGNKLKRVEEIFEVHRGADPGRKYFIVAKEYYKTLSKNEQIYFRPCIDSSTIIAGQIKKEDYLFYPKTYGLPQFQSETQLKKFLPKFYKDILLPNKKELISRIGFDEANWWHLQRHRPWQEKKISKLVSSAFGKAGNFGYDSSGEYVVEQSCAWLPIADFMNENIQYAYLAILNSHFFNRLLAIYSKQLAGGEWYNLQTKHVKDIPLPDLMVLSDSSYESLSKYGRAISKGVEINEEELNKTVLNLYNISD
ncbi:MAG TPA: N-6 DNA methylase [Bacteroidia bacterium]|nr:N-6 DNA methylase [Bacteroidia bacterium]